MHTGIVDVHCCCCCGWQARAGQCQTARHAELLQQDLEPEVECTCLMAAGAVWEKGSHLNSSRCWED